jgi:hypothetical protein
MSQRGKALVWDAVEVEIFPEPSDEERAAILEALARAEAAPAAYRSPWRAAALAELGGDAAAEDPWGDPRVVEP